MKHIAVVSALILSVSVPFAAAASKKAVPQSMSIMTPTKADMLEADRVTTLMAEYGPVNVMIRNQQKIVDDSKSLFLEKAVSAEECSKLIQASNASLEVIAKRSSKIKDAFLKDKLAEHLRYVMAGNTAYIKYYKGDMASRIEAEKQWQQAETCDNAIRKYIQQGK